MTREQLKEFACHKSFHVRRCANRALQTSSVLIKRENIKRIEEHVANQKNR